MEVAVIVFIAVVGFTAFAFLLALLGSLWKAKQQRRPDDLKQPLQALDDNARIAAERLHSLAREVERQRLAILNLNKRIYDLEQAWRDKGHTSFFQPPFGADAEFTSI